MRNFVIAVVALEANLERGLCGGSLAVVVKTALVETGVLGIVTCAEGIEPVCQTSVVTE